MNAQGGARGGAQHSPSTLFLTAVAVALLNKGR